MNFFYRKKTRYLHRLRVACKRSLTFARNVRGNDVTRNKDRKKRPCIDVKPRLTQGRLESNAYGCN